MTLENYTLSQLKNEIKRRDAIIVTKPKVIDNVQFDRLIYIICKGIDDIDRSGFTEKKTF